MRARQVTVLVVLALAFASAAWAQSRETGAIVGQVKDEQANPLPGVNVTLRGASMMGTRATVTDAEGRYRFPALPPGEYTLKYELQGFGTSNRERVRVTTTTTLTLVVEMKPSAVAEEVTVQAQVPTIDVKSTETASVTLSNEVLRNIPYSQFTSDIVNMAPGVNDDVAYGAQSGTGVAWSMDGVNVSDPEAGTAWVFLDHNIIEEAKIMGIGLPAEYGGFTGVIFNIVTKTGGNNFAGHFEADFQGKKEDWPSGFWQQDNNASYLTDFPDLTSPRYAFYDMSAHLGGPIKKDKLWFYEGLQFQHFADYAAGFPADQPRAYDQPRSFTKITSQLSTKTNLNFSLEVDTYNGKNRGASATTLPESTVRQKSPEVVGNLNMTHILSPKTFFDLKVSYFWGYYYLDPETGVDTYSHLDLNANKWLKNSGYYYYADRTRFQANASLTHYTENFITGTHDFKFGAEVEHSWSKTRYGYTGKGGPLGDHVVYNDYVGYGYTGNYLAYQYDGYVFDISYTRVEAFAQDSWQVTPRLNVSAGLRFTQNYGTIADVPGTPFKTNRIAPRVGFTFDLLGDKSTVLKAHYGQFTEGMFAAFHEFLSPKWYDYVSYYWSLDDQQWYEFERIQHKYTLQSGIKHPYMDQVTVSLERELFKDTSLSVAYIYRKWNDIIGVVDHAAMYEPVTVHSDALDKDFTIYELSSDPYTHQFETKNITKNPSEWVMGDPYRKYQGLEVLFNKRFSNRWQFLASFLYSVCKGTIDNGQADDIGWNTRRSMIAGDPNYWINADGHSTFDPTYQIKVQGTYVLPLDISLSAYYHAVTGQSWTQEFRTKTLAQGRVTFFTQPRGTNHYPMSHLLDMRLEKIFTVGQKYRLGVILDAFNLFNQNTITSWGTRIGYDWNPGEVPSGDGHDITGIVQPRQVRVGVRLIF